MMITFLDSMMDLILYFLGSITIDDIIISAPVLFVIFSMLFLIFRKAVGLR